MTALTGAGGGMYLPPWDAYLNNEPSPANAWVAFLLNMSVPALVLPIMLFAGWVDRARHGNSLQILTTVVSVLATIGLLVWAFLYT